MPLNESSDLEAKAIAYRAQIEACLAMDTRKELSMEDSKPAMPLA